MVDGAVLIAAEDPDQLRREDLRRSGTPLPDGRVRYLFSAPSIHCGRCIASIEQALAHCPGVDEIRVNLTLRRVAVTLHGPDGDPCLPLDALARLGFPATVLDLAGGEDGAPSAASGELLKAMAVAGFAAANIMLMSISVWAGAEGDVRYAFHLFSGAIALPVVAYSGRPFFRSAWRALAAGRLNMDVPISLGVLLTAALSVFETARGGEQVFFDAAVTLLFFLLIGRYLDQLMRERARSAVLGLTRLAAKGAMRVGKDGHLDYVTLDEVEPGMVMRVAAGERVAVDGRVLDGTSDFDRSLVTGESRPVFVGPGDEIEAGTLNLTGPVDVVALRPAGASFLAEVGRMLQAAEAGRGRYVRIADRASRLYSPVVHLLALITFAGWLSASGGDWHRSLFIAISVLIITCPCALGLAVPIVHVVAAGRLFRDGILMKDGSGLERLAEIDRAVFDKTGTLTTGSPALVRDDLTDAAERAIAQALAARSAHPASRSIAASLEGERDGRIGLEDVREIPGQGIEARVDDKRVRLGRADWVAELTTGGDVDAEGTAFAVEGADLRHFTLCETLRTGAREAVAELAARGIAAELLSGDAEAPVRLIAREVGLGRATARCTPADKVRHLEALRETGAKTLMVGDGLNDAAALAASHVSIAPASAAEVGRQAADFVFTRESLAAVPAAHEIAVRAAQLVRQNFGLAILYNAVAIPLAVAGFVTPLVAALAMSGSSILVVANALRLHRRVSRTRETVPAPIAAVPA